MPFSLWAPKSFISEPLVLTSIGKSSVRVRLVNKIVNQSAYLIRTVF